MQKIVEWLEHYMEFVPESPHLTWNGASRLVPSAVGGSVGNAGKCRRIAAQPTEGRGRHYYNDVVLPLHPTDQ